MSLAQRLRVQFRRATATPALSLPALTLPALVLFVACGQAKWHEVGKAAAPATLTGDPKSEAQITRTLPQNLQPGQTVTVASNRLCGRRIPSKEKCSDQDVPLENGDKVAVDDPTPTDGLVKGHVTDSNRKDVNSTTVYVPPQYLNTDDSAKDPAQLNANRYFVVQNIATGKLRVYERLSDCQNQILLETDMLVGQDIKGGHTKLGSFTLGAWSKFYEDGATQFPSWYSPEYPKLPAAGSDLGAWLDKALLPSGKGELRGAYGWFNAQLEPDADDQGISGTVGWGADGDKLLKALENAPANETASLGVKGETRVENRAIALMREILVPGTKIMRIYAREQQDRTSSVHGSGHWDYILTTETSANAPRAGRRSVLSRGIPQDLYLETGRYEFKANATASQVKNIYHVPENELVGSFSVASGRLSDDYQAPPHLELGGHPDHHLPSVIYTSPRCVAPKPTPVPAPQEMPEPAPPVAPPTRPSHALD